MQDFFFQIKCFHVFHKVLISKIILKKQTNHKPKPYSFYYDFTQDRILPHFYVYVDERSKKMQQYYAR